MRSHAAHFFHGQQWRIEKRKEVYIFVKDGRTRNIISKVPVGN